MSAAPRPWRRRPRPAASSRSAQSGLFFDWFAAHRARRHAVSRKASTSRRSGVDKVNAIINCHLFDRAHRPSRHGAVLAHRPAQCDGRPRGRRARQSAGRAYGDRRIRRIANWCSGSGDAPAIAEKAGLKAVDMFDAIARRPHQGGVDHRRPIRWCSLPDADRARAALDSAASSSW